MKIQVDKQQLKEVLLKTYEESFWELTENLAYPFFISIVVIFFITAVFLISIVWWLCWKKLKKFNIIPLFRKRRIIYLYHRKR